MMKMIRMMVMVVEVVVVIMVIMMLAYHNPYFSYLCSYSLLLLGNGILKNYFKHICVNKKYPLSEFC